jgi:hypothetical protein
MYHGFVTNDDTLILALKSPSLLVNYRKLPREYIQPPDKLMKRFFQHLHGPWSASHNRKDPDLNIVIDYCNTQNAVRLYTDI